MPANTRGVASAGRRFLSSVFAVACNLNVPGCEQKWQVLAFVRDRCDRALWTCDQIDSVRDCATMFKISDPIRRTETADGGILLDILHGQMFSLNIVGAKILELMQKGYDESRIADEISRGYGVSREVVYADVVDFIETLQKHHILQPIRSADVA
jgi:hypothetical protein